MEPHHFVALNVSEDHAVQRIQESTGGNYAENADQSIAQLGKGGSYQASGLC